jgi:hypothetical protein
VSSFRLDPEKEGKVKRYYHELESGQLEPDRVDQRVWAVLAETLGARAADLLGWRPRPPEVPAQAFARASAPMMTAMRADGPAPEPEDEVDRLFRMDPNPR